MSLVVKKKYGYVTFINSSNELADLRAAMVKISGRAGGSVGHTLLFSLFLSPCFSPNVVQNQALFYALQVYASSILICDPFNVFP